VGDGVSGWWDDAGWVVAWNHAGWVVACWRLDGPARTSWSLKRPGEGEVSGAFGVCRPSLVVWWLGWALRTGPWNKAC